MDLEDNFFPKPLKDMLYKLSVSFERYSIFLKIIFRGKYSKNDTDTNDAQM